MFVARPVGCNIPNTDSGMQTVWPGTADVDVRAA